jgi:hypothetical protein
VPMEEEEEEEYQILYNRHAGRPTAQCRYYAAPTLTLYLTSIPYFCIMILIIQEDYFSKHR